MILLYSLLLSLLGVVKTLANLRARTLERKFTRVAAAVSQLVSQPDYKPGNSNKPDQTLFAKRLVLLGRRVEERDRVEAKYFAWQRWADRLSGWVHAARTWKGKKLPYTMGAVDVWMLLCAVDYFGVGQYVSTAALIQFVVSLYRE